MERRRKSGEMGYLGSGMDYVEKVACVCSERRPPHLTNNAEKMACVPHRRAKPTKDTSLSENTELRITLVQGWNSLAYMLRISSTPIKPQSQ